MLAILVSCQDLFLKVSNEARRKEHGPPSAVHRPETQDPEAMGLTNSVELYPVSVDGVGLPVKALSG
jgi:hypothetical protein